MVKEELQKKNKDKLFRGKTIEELKKLDTREFAKLVKSRPRRALLRNYDIIEAFVAKSEERAKKNKQIKTHNRALVVVPKLVGKSIGIHNGKEFVKVDITEEMLGHRFGEFALTRKIAKHTNVGLGASKSSQALKK